MEPGLEFINLAKDAGYAEKLRQLDRRLNPKLMGLGLGQEIPR